jgi:hypothetical protein
MTLPEIDRDYRAELARLREKRGLTTREYQAERRRIDHHFAGERDKMIRQKEQAQ